MQDLELIRMAAFKLQEAAKRLEQLAQESASGSVRQELRTVIASMRSHERKLWALAGEPSQRKQSSGRAA